MGERLLVSKQQGSLSIQIRKLRGKALRVNPRFLLWTTRYPVTGNYKRSIGRMNMKYHTDF